MSNAFAIILHLLAINIWIGGTFFTVMILPRALVSLETLAQYHLLARILRHFFSWVWLAILLVIASGTWMVMNVFGNLQNMPSYVFGMIALALTMMAVFVLMFFGPYRHYRVALQAQDLAECRRRVGQVRLLSKINMFLGIGVLIVIGTGIFFMV